MFLCGMKVHEILRWGELLHQWTHLYQTFPYSWKTNEVKSCHIVKYQTKLTMYVNDESMKSSNWYNIIT